MTDSEFAEAFENCALPSFQHRDHIRLAWIYLSRYGEPLAAVRIGESIRAFAARHGKSGKYHETVTQAWMRLVAARAKNAAPDFESFIAGNAALLDKSMLSQFYSEAVLGSALAREQFVAPDLAPLP